MAPRNERFARRYKKVQEAFTYKHKVEGKRLDIIYQEIDAEFDVSKRRTQEILKNYNFT